MDEMVSRSNDGIAEYNGIEDVTGLVGFGVELCWTVVYCAIVLVPTFYLSYGDDCKLDPS
jgi:hypothetical protein